MSKTDRTVHTTEHKGPVCDICLRPDPRWIFDGPDPDGNRIVEAEGEALFVTDSGSWATCTRCSNLVMRKRVQRLAEVCVYEGSERCGLQFNPSELAAYMVERMEYFRKVIAGLGPRRTRNAAERQSKGEVHIGQSQRPDQN